MVFDFTETESQQLIVKAVKEWCDKNITPERVRKMDDEGHPYPKDIAEGLGKLGAIMGTVPQEHGGLGIDWKTQCLIAEVIGYCDPTVATAAGFMAVETGWGFTINRYCSEIVREKYVKPAIKGEKFIGIATTEPVGGSDVAGHKTTAKKEGNEWVLNGEKTFISGTEECKLWGGG
ncbi:MAG: acyl-CoA dehydrogenase family protein, partial [Candidatus Bathyarchaeia archaeon]